MVLLTGQLSQLQLQSLQLYTTRASSSNLYLIQLLLIPLLFITYIKSLLLLLALLPCYIRYSIFYSSRYFLRKANILLSRALFLLLIFPRYPPPLPPIQYSQRAFSGQRWCQELVYLAQPLGPLGPVQYYYQFPQTNSSINIITAFIFIVIIIIATIIRGSPLKLFLRL